MKLSTVALALMASLVFPISSRGTISVLGYWRMGENDSGAVSGQAVTNLTALIGGKNLKFQGTGYYSNDVAATASINTSSTLSVNFSAGNSWASNSVVSTSQAYFGLEAWIKPMSIGAESIIAYNGNTANSGWGLALDPSNHLQCLFGGVSIFSGPVVPTNVWSHVALMDNSYYITMYLNGTPVLTNSVVFNPNVPTVGFAVGGPPQGGSGMFVGLVDELRVFTFADGNFNVGDLLLNEQKPVVATGAPTGLTPNSGIITGTVNPSGLATGAWFQWGATTNYGQVTAVTNFAATVAVFAVSNSFTGLVPGSAFHYQLVASNSLGTNFGGDFILTAPIFSKVNAGITALWAGSVAWGDFDNDGRLDLLVSGSRTPGGLSQPTPTTQIWHNNGGNTFSNITANVTPVWNSAVAWGDYDNDGRLDILLCGFTTPDYASLTTEIWHNNGNGTFSNINAGLTSVGFGSVAWGDYNNDGRLDILIAGGTNLSSGITQLWRNNGDGTFSNVKLGLPGFLNGSVAWGDYDNDGRLDILLCGGGVTQVWRNNGDDTFSNINAGLPNVSTDPGTLGCAAWGDYDNDGWLDILIAGNGFAQVWRNNGNGTFTNINAGLPSGLQTPAVAWADFDNDGRLDILLTGHTNGNFFVSYTQVWRNNGDGSFSNLQAGLTALGTAAIACGDYDHDGRLDILLFGLNDGIGFDTALYHGAMVNTNTPPSAPSGLSVAFSGPALTFSWNPASDLQTPAAGLTYNFRLGTTPGGADVFNPMSASDGFRRVSKKGDRQQLTLSLPAVESTYYWSVQAVDNGFAGSPFAPENAFKLVYVRAPAGATNYIPGDLNGDGVVDQSELNAVLSRLGTNGTVNPSNLSLLLGNYFGDSLEMRNVNGLGGSHVSFTLSNSPPANLNVEFSTNQVDWQPLGPVKLGFGFTDTNAPASPHRFYRLSRP